MIGNLIIAAMGTVIGFIAGALVILHIKGDHIRCTPEQVVEAVMVEFRAKAHYDGYAQCHVIIGANEEDMAQRIAANLIQLTQRGR